MPKSPTLAAETAAEHTRGTPSTAWALAGLSLSMLLASLGTSTANIALPTLAQAFGATFQAVQWVVLAYLLAVTTAIVGAGRLGDIAGRRRLLLAGLIVFTAASLLCGAASTLAWLILARAAQGLGAAVMMALALALIGDAVSKERTGSAMGLLATMSAVGTALGPSLGGVLISWLGWRAIFLVNLPLGLLALLLAQRGLSAERERPMIDRATTGFDGLGTLLLALTLAAYALAMTVGRGRFGTLNLALLAASAVGAALFVRVEARATSPLLRLTMLRDPMLGSGLAASALVSTVLMATLVVGPFYLTGALALDPARVGLVMSTGPLVVALTGVPAGRIVDRLGAQPVTLAGLAAIAIGSLALSMLPASFGVAGYVVPLVVLTAGYGLFQTANNTAVMADVGADRRGVVSGLLNLSRNLGLVSGASVMGAVFAAGAGTADAAAGLRATFAVATVLIGVALIAAIGGRARPPDQVGGADPI